MSYQSCPPQNKNLFAISYISLPKQVATPAYMELKYGHLRKNAINAETACPEPEEEWGYSALNNEELLML